MLKNKVIRVVVILFIIIQVFSPIYVEAFSFSDVLVAGKKFVRVGDGATLTEGEVSSISTAISNVLLVIALGVTLISIVVIAINLMTQSVTDKANIKEAILPWMIGVIVAFGAFGIWQLAVNILSEIDVDEEIDQRVEQELAEEKAHLAELEADEKKRREEAIKKAQLSQQQAGENNQFTSSSSYGKVTVENGDEVRSTLGAYGLDKLNDNLLSNAATIWSTLKELGFSDCAIAGVLGNVYQESRFKTNASESGGTGWGLFQWSVSEDNDRRTRFEAYANACGTSYDDFDTQMDFFLAELVGGEYAIEKYVENPVRLTKDGNRIYTEWKNAVSPEAASRMYQQFFEGAGSPNQTIRDTAARAFYEIFANP